jgi:hypothetical protein
VDKELDKILEEYRSRPPTDITSFIDKLSAPIYSWRMARAMVGAPGRPNGAESRMRNAERRIENLVVDYAVVILKRRREEGE